MHLKALCQINAKNTHVTENLQFTMQSLFPGVLREKIVLVLGKYFKPDPRSESKLLSTTVLTIILSAHQFS